MDISRFKKAALLATHSFLALVFASIAIAYAVKLTGYGNWALVQHIDELFPPVATSTMWQVVALMLSCFVAVIDIKKAAKILKELSMGFFDYLYGLCLLILFVMQLLILAYFTVEMLGIEVSFLENYASKIGLNTPGKPIKEIVLTIIAVIAVYFTGTRMTTYSLKFFTIKK